MRFALLKRAAVALIGLSLGACGGGGGPSTGDIRQPPQAASEDNFPAGEQLEAGAFTYVPYADDGNWTYERRWERGGTDTVVVLSRATAGGLLVSEVGDGERRDYAVRRTVRGWEAGGDAFGFGAVTKDIGSVLLYPDRFPKFTGPISQWRTGDLGMDWDGDGVHDGFELSVWQQPVRFETIEEGGYVLPALRVSTDVHVRLLPSSHRRYAESTLQIHSVEWLVAGIGVVRLEREASDSSGEDFGGKASWHLTAVRLQGVDALARSGFSRVRTIDLAHRDLVYDAARRVYYASVSDSDPLRARRIATIDSATGAVSLSEPLAASLGPLAIARDGASLYVGTIDTGEVVRLSLPTMAVLQRTQLPASALAPIRPPLQLAASPLDPGTVAASLSNGVGGTNYAGTVLIRDGTLQSRGSEFFESGIRADAIGFSHDGQAVLALGTRFGSLVMHQFDLVPDGIQHSVALPLDDRLRYGSIIERLGADLLSGRSVLGLDGTFVGSVAGTATSSVECRPQRGLWLVCLLEDPLAAPELLVVDSTDFSTTHRLPLVTEAFTDTTRRVVPGPTGAVAIREVDQFGRPAPSRVILLQNAAIP